MAIESHLGATAFVDPAQTGTNNKEQPRGGIVKNIEQNEKWSWNCVESNIKSNICFSGRSSQRYKLLTAFGHLKKKNERQKSKKAL